MTTKRTLAFEYGARLREAAQTQMTKSASAGSIGAPEFTAQVTNILNELNELTYGATQLPLSAEDVREICDLIDAELGVSADTLWMVKKGSVKGLITYQMLVMQLLNGITYG